MGVASRFRKRIASSSFGEKSAALAIPRSDPHSPRRHGDLQTTVRRGARTRCFPKGHNFSSTQSSHLGLIALHVFSESRCHSYNLTTWDFGSLLALAYVNIHRLDHSFYPLLAAGHSGFGIVSCFLDNCTAIQVTWYSSGWRFRFAKRHHFVARKVATTRQVIILFTFAVVVLLRTFHDGISPKAY